MLFEAIFQLLLMMTGASSVTAFRPVFRSLGPKFGSNNRPPRLAFKQSSTAVAQPLQAIAMLGVIEVGS